MEGRFNYYLPSDLIFLEDEELRPVVFNRDVFGVIPSSFGPGWGVCRHET